MAKPIPAAKRSTLCTVHFGQDICDLAIDEILARVGSNPLDLSDSLIFLPNNRAIKALTEAFVRRSENGLLLPKMVALGDLELDEALGAMLDPLDCSETILPAIDVMNRLLLLAKLIADHRAAKEAPIKTTEALRLARFLAATIDELAIEKKSVRDISNVPYDQELAGHWQASYGDLLALLPLYEQELTRLGLMNAADRRNALLGALTEKLRLHASTHLIAAVGISTAAPAITQLLKTLASLPQALIIFPPIDLAMEEAEWQNLGPHDSNEPGGIPKRSLESHPQYQMKLILDRMGIRREEISIIGGKNAILHDKITRIFCNSQQTTGWRLLSDKEKNLPHVTLIEAEDSALEARSIALKVREALENPKQRIAIITPDRELAVRVAAQLLRWNISVDDSAGQPLIQTAHGTLMMALVTAVTEQWAPTALLALLKHPLTMQGEERQDWLAKTRQLDMHLRGPASGVGMIAIAETLDKLAAKLELDKAQAETQSQHDRIEKHLAEIRALETWFADVTAKTAALENALDLGFSALMDAIIAALSAFCTDAVWKGYNGRQLSQFIEELIAANPKRLGQVDRKGLVSVFRELFGQNVVRPQYGGHPRVAIYGLLEARLQRADIVICAGLNEGTWPQMPQPDPWLAPHLRRELGLASLDRNIGLSAHDMASALGAEKVIVTRARRDRGGPTITSRFLLRMQALLGDKLKPESQNILWSEALDAAIAGDHFVYAQPKPKPTIEQRNVTLSVTDFDRLKADPYAFYASKILRLRPLEIVEADPSHAWRGTFIHDVLEQWAKEDKADPETLVARTQSALQHGALHPALRVMWAPKIIQSMEFIAAKTISNRDEIQRRLITAEEKGHAILCGVKITGRVDRIDKSADGNLIIIDYKTGNPPKPKQINAGFALQLGLNGWIAESGGFSKITGQATGFEYWSLNRDSRSKIFGYITSAVDLDGKGKLPAADIFVKECVEHATNLIGGYILNDDPFTAKLHPEYALYSDYDQLMRYAEWDGRQSIAADNAA